MRNNDRAIGGHLIPPQPHGATSVGMGKTWATMLCNSALTYARTGKSLCLNCSINFYPSLVTLHPSETHPAANRGTLMRLELTYKVQFVSNRQCEHFLLTSVSRIVKYSGLRLRGTAQLTPGAEQVRTWVCGSSTTAVIPQAHRPLLTMYESRLVMYACSYCFCCILKICMACVCRRCCSSARSSASAG